MPTFGSEPTVDLSVVIPAYNERERLPEMLDECIECLRTAKKQTWVGFILSIKKFWTKAFYIMLSQVQCDRNSVRFHARNFRN